MAAVDYFIGLFKRLLTCYEVRRRSGEMICGTFVVLSCGFGDARECFVAKSNCFEKIDFFGQIWKELNIKFKKVESTQTDEKEWKVSIEKGEKSEKPLKYDPVYISIGASVSVRFNVESKRKVKEFCAFQPFF